MITLRTNPEFLSTLAADTREAGREETAKDLDNAAQDLDDLRSYAHLLEDTVNRLSSKLQSRRNTQEELTAALFDIFRPNLEQLLDDMLQESRPLEDLRDRIERLEEAETEGEDIRREVREMIHDGEIVVSIDVS